MGEDFDGRFDGIVSRYFDGRDKLAFVKAFCAERDIPLSACVAVGDSRSDVPLFEAVGFSVALNATPDAKAAATLSITADTLTAVLHAVPGLLPADDRV